MHGPFLAVLPVEPDGHGVVEQHCHLIIFPYAEDVDFEPDEVTALLGVRPTRVRRRGEQGDDARVQYPRSSYWSFDLPRRFEIDSEALVSELLDAIEPAATGLERVRGELPVEAQVSLAQYLHGYLYDAGDEGPRSFSATSPALAFEATTLERMAGLGLGLDVDQYIYDNTDYL